MDARIILGVQPIDVVGAMRQGNAAAVETNAIRQQNALADLYRTQGQGLMRGNPQSLNALARLDPVQAQNMSISQQELDIKYAEAKRQAAEAARALDDQQRQAQAAELDRILSGAAALYAKGDQAGYTAWLQQNKVDPAQYPFEMFPAHAATVKGAMDALKEFTPEAPKPQSPQAKFEADKKAGLLPPDAVYKSDAPSVTVNNGGGSDKQIFDTLVADRDIARSVASGYASLSEAKRAVDAGIISGSGADYVLALQKAGAAIGVVDPTVIQNTEAFRSAIAPQVAAMLKATAGTANLSNADREFAEKAAGGNINLDAGTIKRLLGIMEAAARTSLEGYQKKLDAIYPDTPQFARERAIFAIPMPTFAAPVAGSGSQDAPPPPANSTPSPQQSVPLTPDLQSIYDKYK